MKFLSTQPEVFYKYHILCLQMWLDILQCLHYNESAKLRTLHAKNVLAFQRALRAYVLTCQRDLRAYVLTC